ncbi:MAG: thermonuclease family protein [Leisingera sp.]
MSGKRAAPDAGTVDFIILLGRDKYGRGLGRVILNGNARGDILISEGLARRYTRGRRKGWCG